MRGRFNHKCRCWMKSILVFPRFCLASSVLINDAFPITCLLYEPSILCTSRDTTIARGARGANGYREYKCLQRQLYSRAPLPSWSDNCAQDNIIIDLVEHKTRGTGSHFEPGNEINIQPRSFSWRRAHGETLTKANKFTHPFNHPKILWGGRGFTIIAFAKAIIRRDKIVYSGKTNYFATRLRYLRKTLTFLTLFLFLNVNLSVPWIFVGNFYNYAPSACDIQKRILVRFYYEKYITYAH